MSSQPERNRSAFLPLRFHLECNFAAVRRCASQVRSYLVAHGLAEKDVWACELALVEGCNNAVQYTPAQHASEKLLVELKCAPTHIELRINDHTEGFDLPVQTELPVPDQESGRGIFLMRSLMDEVDYVRRGSTNCLILKKAVTGI